MLPSTPQDAGSADATTDLAADPKVCCVIVNWNGWRDTLECLASLRQQDYGSLQVIVVDNGSTNDSVERIRAGFPEVQVIAAGENLGFAKGTNVGLRAGLAGGADFLWLLNNDTVCPPDTLRKLVRKAQQVPEAGLVGSVLYYMHDPARVQAWGGGAVKPWIGYTTHFTTPHQLNTNTFTTFASALARRAMLEEVGLLYEGSFMYYEDSDFCLRMQRTRWKIAIAEDTAILHKEGGSVPKGENPFMTQVITVSGLRFIRRNSRLAWLGMPVFVALRIGRRVIKGERRGVAAVLRGAMQFLREPMPS